MKKSRIVSSVVIILIGAFIGFSNFGYKDFTIAKAEGAHISIWWPAQNAVLKGLQPFKALVDGMTVDQYSMFWQVDNGQLNSMETNNDEKPHKEALVNLENWNWQSASNYNVNFVAKDTSGAVIAEQSVVIHANVAGDSDSPSDSATSTPSETHGQNSATNSATTGAVQNNNDTSAGSGAQNDSEQQAEETLPSNLDVNVIWPANNQTVNGVEKFKAVYSDINLDKYMIFWSVDSGQYNLMINDAESKNKEASVSFSGWNWKGAGPYNVNFIVQNLNGHEVAKKSVTVFVGDGTVQNSPSPSPTETVTPTPTPTIVVTPPPQDTVTPTPSPSQSPYTTPEQTPIPSYQPSITPSVTPTQTPQIIPNTNEPLGTPLPGPAPSPQSAPQPTFKTTPSILKPKGSTPTPVISAKPTPVKTTSPTNPLRGMKFYVDPNNNAAQQEILWKYSRPEDALQMEKISYEPAARWFGDWNPNIEGDVKNYVDSASSQGQTAVMIAYNIPERDCGNYSAGGSNGAQAYRTWISGMAKGIGNRKAIVILEPDALPLTTCLNSDQLATRYDLINYAIDVLKAGGNTYVYVDAGNSNWISADEMSKRLVAAGIVGADGFSLNVSNYYKTNDLVNYGEKLSALLGNKHFVIDTSRNGSGSNGEWCNPGGRSLGQKPTTATGNDRVDAFLWLKAPGESDGQCNGGPSAGVWWPDYALGLAQRAN